MLKNLVALSYRKFRSIRAKLLLYRLLNSHNKSSSILDIGANLGVFSRKFLEKGCTVVAVEPDPFTFTILQENLTGFPNLVLVNKAVSLSSGSMTLYRHERYKESPQKYSQGSSLVPTKSNISTSDGVRISTISLRDLRALTSIDYFHLVKIDIEGHEIALLLDMIRNNDIYWFEYMVVEMHDHKILDLNDSATQLRSLIKSSKTLSSRINLNWH